MQSFPPQALRGARIDEHTLELRLISGNLPSDIDGFWFVIAAVGTPSDGAIKASRTTPFLNGEGVIYKLRMHEGAVTAHSKVVENLSFRADQLAASDDEFETIRFQQMGISRGSMLDLGTRDMSNTAIVPWAANVGAPPVLLACYDSGRPHCIDPETLATFGPISPTKEWIGQLAHLRPFPQFMSGAHPAYDPTNGDLFAVNYARDLTDMMGPIAHLFERLGLRKDNGVLQLNGGRSTLPVDKILARGVPGLVEDSTESGIRGVAPPKWTWIDASEPDDQRGPPLAGEGPYEAERLLQKSGASFDLMTGQVLGWDERADWVGWYLRAAFRLLFKGLRFLKELWQQPPERFVSLHAYRSGTHQTYRLTHNGKPLRIRGSIHQIAVTKRYVVVVDTSFKFELDFIISSEEGKHKMARRWLRDRLSGRQPDTSPVYLVPRAALVGGVSSVEVIATELKYGAVHFFAKYDDSHSVDLLCAHSNGMDPAEFLDDVDYDAVTGGSIADALHGLFCGPTDVSPIALNRIEVSRNSANAECVSQVTAQPTPAGKSVLLWGVGLGCAVGNPGPADSGSIERTFWTTSGLVPHIVSKRARHLYFLDPPHKDRLVSEEDWVKAMKTGTPASVFRADVQSDEVTITDAWQAPMGWTTCTPQFIPSSDLESAGYLGCVVFTQTEPFRRILLFSADNLAVGPIAEFDADALKWPYTLHSAWLEEIATNGHAAANVIDIDKKYDGLVGQLLDRLQGRRPTSG
jgi:carotenoid cleavage dioxygenase-like enzyme